MAAGASESSRLSSRTSKQAAARVLNSIVERCGHRPDAIFYWRRLLGTAVPPRDSDDDEDEGDEGDGGEDDDHDAAVTREPDEE